MLTIIFSQKKSKMKKAKLTAVIALTAICTVTAISSSKLNSKADGKFWVGVTYLASEHGYSNAQTAGIGVFGVFHGAMEGAIWGSAFGGPAGAAAGIVAGL